MENKLPKTNKKRLLLPVFFLNDIEPIIRDIQLRILRRSSRIPENNRVTLSFVQEFEWSSNWASSLIASLDGDSRYLFQPEIRLPSSHDPDAIIALFQEENRLTPKSISRLKIDEHAGIVERLKHFHIADIDYDLVEALYEAYSWVVTEFITEENCLRQLETARDTVHRAELFMMMGNDVEAYREFKSITPEESSNPDNTLILVDLFERYESPKAAIKILRSWFLLETILHPLLFDLVRDILTDRKKIEPSPRLQYLKSILIHAKDMPYDELNDHLTLVIPSDVFIIPDPDEIDRRLNMFGLNLNSMGLALDEHEPINLYPILADVINQLLHLADLALSSKNEKYAIKVLERAILAFFTLLNMPDTDDDDIVETDNFELILNHIDLNGYLDDIIGIYNDIRDISPSISKYTLIDKMIASLQTIIKKQAAADNILEESDGMPGLL